MLAVVKHKENLARANVVDDRAEGQRPLASIDAEGNGKRGRELRGILERGEIDPHHPILKSRRNVPRNSQRQPRLADAAGPSQGEERSGLINKK